MLNQNHFCKQDGDVWEILFIQQLKSYTLKNSMPFPNDWYWNNRNIAEAAAQSSSGTHNFSFSVRTPP